jgi:hypothetical protein
VIGVLTLSLYDWRLEQQAMPLSCEVYLVDIAPEFLGMGIQRKELNP